MYIWITLVYIPLRLLRNRSVIPRDDVQVRDNLTVETLPVRIDDRKVKALRGKEIPL
ncbi:hypothetical protein MTR_0158s0020, partial [Medicago truncatula]